jgi:hypothetical protein
MSGEGDVGAYWGLWDKDGKLKYAKEEWKVKSEKPARLTKQMLTFSFHLTGQAGEEWRVKSEKWKVKRGKWVRSEKEK